ncbi:MAG: flagellar biosynthesis protein FlgL [Erythrobacter sp.]|nr:flagellar biosynthesis protein FlgL [Erythrobacter sp.]
MIPIGNPFGAFYERSLVQMNALRGSAEKIQNQIATGQRIERGSEDPAAAARLRALARIERLSEVEEDNADKLARDLDEAGDEVLGVSNLLARARELAIQAASDTLGTRGREAIAAELAQLEEELFNRANARTLTGEPLFAGTAAGPAYIRQADGTVSYNGNADSASVPIAPGTEIERGLPGPAIFEFTLGGTPSSAFAVLGNLAAALNGGSPDPAAAAQAAIEGLDEAIDNTTRSQTILGTRLAWVETIQQSQAERRITLAEQRSQIGETDIGDAIVRLQQTLTALEASQASFSRVSALTLFDAI